MSARLSQYLQPAGKEFAFMQKGKYRAAVINRLPNTKTASPAPVIFFVHGMGDTSATWLSIIPAFGKYDVWCFEMPWSGVDGSNWGDKQSAVDWWTDALKLCPVKPDLCVGHSFATAVLLQWALTQTDNMSICKLVLVSPIFLLDKKKLVWDDIDAYARNIPRQLANMIHDKIGRDRSLSPEILSAMAGRITDRILPSGVIEIFSILQKLVDAPVENLSNKITIIQGDRDTSLVSEGVNQLAIRTNTCVHKLNDCGHVPMIEKADTLATILTTIPLKTRSSEIFLNEAVMP